MMKKYIKINKPCPEKWENMQNSPQGKFCEICSKNVVDFTEKTENEIQDILDNANGNEICGRIPSSSSFSKIAAGIILMTNIGFIQAQTINTNQKTEIASRKNTIIQFSGTLLNGSDKQPISNAEVYFIHLKKLLKTVTDENGVFSLAIPYNLVNKENMIYINLEKVNDEIEKSKDTIMRRFDNQKFILSKEDLLRKKTYDISPERFTEIGAVVITTPTPPDYYYFNGKSIGERKFEKLKKENPNYQYFSFEGKEAEIISKISFLDSLQLLYSK